MTQMNLKHRNRLTDFKKELMAAWVKDERKG